jgi:hypothetical protein
MGFISIPKLLVIKTQAKKLSEKVRRCDKRGLPGHRSGTIRPVSAPIYRPNPRSERCSYPFSDSFKGEVRRILIPRTPVNKGKR